jgi:hypothetical protein
MGAVKESWMMHESSLIVQLSSFGFRWGLVDLRAMALLELSWLAWVL